MSEEKKWSDIREIKPDGFSGWYGGAYTLAFVYSNKGNFLVKGYIREVEANLDELINKGYKFIVNITLWCRMPYTNEKHCRNIWRCSNNNVYINDPSYGEKGTDSYGKWEMFKYENGFKGKKNRKLFKRLPKKWIPYFEDLI